MRFPPRRLLPVAPARRNTFIRAACTAALIAASALGVAPTLPAAAAPGVTRAMVAMARLDADFFDTRRGYYTVSRISHGPVASVWPTSQVLAAAIDLARMTHAPADAARVRRIIASLRGYLAQGAVYQSRTTPSRRYTDDNNWIALDLLNAYDMTHDATLLAPVERIFAFVTSKWDTRRGGGILWADGHLERCTVSQGPAITIGLRLAAITGRRSYRRWADRVYAWENAHMRRPDGLYWDSIVADGVTINRDIVSYNQGVMIDANLTYAWLTGQDRYLGEARRIARAAARALPVPWHSRGMYANFDAIYAWSLVHLDAVWSGAASLEPIEEYLNWAWPTAQAPRTPAHRTEYDLLEQAGYVMDAAAIARYHPTGH